MENTYKLIKRLENELDFNKMLQKGIIPLSVFTKKVYYEFYLNDLKQSKDNRQSIFNTAYEYRVSEKTIQRAIKYMLS